MEVESRTGTPLLKNRALPWDAQREVRSNSAEQVIPGVANTATVRAVGQLLVLANTPPASQRKFENSKLIS